MNNYISENKLYLEDLSGVANIDSHALAGSRLLIVGATGLIGRYLVDYLMYMNEMHHLFCYITVLSRTEKSARSVFPDRYFKSEFFKFIGHDICDPIQDDVMDGYDYVIHLASNTHPIAYAMQPIDTILANVYGTKNLLDQCAKHHGCRFLLPSSVEIYGENRGDVDLFDEDYVGYLNSNTLRAGYPESKRLCETLCQAYIKEKSVYAVIPRLPRVFGPTMRDDDSKAVAQFIKKSVANEEIVLKSDGQQHYSFLYAPDAVRGILTVLLHGKRGQAYNIANESCDGTLMDVARICAVAGGVRVIREDPEETEKQGYSTATHARLDGSKIRLLGWKPQYNLEEGLIRTITILRQMSGRDEK